MFLQIAAVCLGYIALVLAETQSCSGDDYQIIPKKDCTGFYICSNGQAIEMPDCREGTVFSASANACVHKGGSYDDCIPDLGSLTIEEQCNIFGGIIPHPTACQLYYNCSLVYEYIPTYFEQHLMECSYPNLFNVESEQCEPFENVECGSRTEPINGCDYISNHCPVAHCIPCSIRFPSCKNLADGIHVHEQKLWSPYFVVCYKERFLAEERCPDDDEGRTQLFHPDLNQCVSLDLIPQQYGGMMPECQNKTDGNHQDDFGRCDRYHVCEGGQYINTVKCNSGEVFDAVFRVCIPAAEACGPCGNNSSC